MRTFTIEEYREKVRQDRESHFTKPLELVNKALETLGYSEKEEAFYFDNASKIVEEVRWYCWKNFLEEEKLFTSEMLVSLIDKKHIETLNAEEAIFWFAGTYPEHIYALNLSNTQSRRSRAGKEFEYIIEALFMGAGLPFDSQGVIGKKRFEDKGLGKMVDLVCPSVTAFESDKMNTILISAKTTLRERWQEVPEEMGRTGASEMFLVTLDSTISDDVLNALYEANIRIVTTQNIVDEKYSHNKRVLTFEKLLAIARSKCVIE